MKIVAIIFLGLLTNVAARQCHVERPGTHQVGTCAGADCQALLSGLTMNNLCGPGDTGRPCQFSTPALHDSGFCVDKSPGTCRISWEAGVRSLDIPKVPECS
ncbi:hypothetical protein DdX_05047 [Ditylenchus destructor]|uniref:Uncharacterized protein n=1 Tax=Ditylenchus destructor TaxID=166010 RepID=A0AAD4NC01_9BILA|nr:hypothetical protein DdX_05047 [Ditylenchus destructor]